MTTKITAAIIAAMLFVQQLSAQKRVDIQPGERWYPNAMTNLNIAAGDTINFLSGNYGECSLLNLLGTPDKPVIVTNTGQVRMGAIDNNTRYCLKIEGSYFKLIGKPDYSFKFVSPLAGKFPLQRKSFIGNSIDFGASTNYEVAFLDIGWTELGLKSNLPSGDLRKDIYIHHNKFHHTNNLDSTPGNLGRCEAIYFGNTDGAYTSTTATYRFVNLRIEFNEFDSIAGDAIQAAIAESIRVYGNRMTNGGLNNYANQFTAILFGGCTNGIIDSNFVTNWNGPAVQLFGYNVNKVTRNRFINCAQYYGNDQDVIYIYSKCPDLAKIGYEITDNYIQGGKRYGINDAGPASMFLSGKVSGNTVIGTAAAAYVVKVPVDQVVTPPPPTPSVSITLSGNLITRTLSIPYSITGTGITKRELQFSKDGVIWETSGALRPVTVATNAGTLPYGTNLATLYVRLAVTTAVGTTYSSTLKF